MVIMMKMAIGNKLNFALSIVVQNDVIVDLLMVGGR